VIKAYFDKKARVTRPDRPSAFFNPPRMDLPAAPVAMAFLGPGDTP
jgi:hypothetical protein